MDDGAVTAFDKAETKNPTSRQPSPEQAPENGAIAELDRHVHAFEGYMTRSLSPTIISLALYDWLIHLGNAPGKRLDLWLKAWEHSLAIAKEAGRAGADADETDSSRPAADRRFASPQWGNTPFNLLRESYLRWEDWWQEAATGVVGVKTSHEKIISFLVRQGLDACSPANHLISNPEILRVTMESSGGNLLRGASNLIEDFKRVGNGEKPGGNERVGHDLAVTPGKVVFRNEMIELIQYSPTTAEVRAEPILIVPAWIMKYYILDLSPQNSLVRYLLDAGFTVFTISWRNPGSAQRHWGMEDYSTSGIAAALDTIADIVPGQPVHACGYCLGGTLLAIEAARLARDGEARLASLTLLAAQTDFTEAGDIKVFTSEDQVAFLDDIMWQRGYLDGKEMAGAFQLLRANDLIWSRFVRQYLLGEREEGTDLTSWNADLTRLPHRMHAEYLRRLFVNNELAQGHFLIDDRPIALTDIRLPLFAVGTETDHIAPWRSVYKIRLLSRSEVTFVLTKGGHNAGIVSEPGHPHRHFRIATEGPEDRFVDPDRWMATTIKHEGSWWPAWVDWLKQRSNPVDVPARKPRQGLCAAPGTYVLEA